MDLVGMSADSSVEIRTDGRSLLITPVRQQSPERRAAFLEAMKDVDSHAGEVLKRLANR
jgi:virulence-associated protein VagC